MMEPSDEGEPLLFNAVTNSPVFGLTERRLFSDSEGGHQVYKTRWLILAIVALLNLSNGMMWMTFEAISKPTSKYYDITANEVDWLSIVFMVATIVVGLFAMWLLDQHGLRVAIVLAAWLNGVGSVVRMLSSVHGLPSHYRYPLLMTGQTLAGCAQPFLLFAPTKLAGQWFSDDQRTLANMVGSTANPIGIMLGSIISTVLVPDVTQAFNGKMDTLLYVIASPACAGLLLATLCVRSSVPPTAPSPSAQEGSEAFVEGIKKLVRIRSYWVLALCYGGGMGLISALVTVLDQLLCPQGYSSYSGLFMSLLFGVGLVGAVFASLVVDKTKKFEETAKICFGLCGCLVVVFMLMLHYSGHAVLLGFLCALIGFFGVGLSPVCLELSVESSFPVAEGTSAGVLVLSGQIQAAIYTLLFTIGATDDEQDLCVTVINQYAIIAFLCITGCLTLIFISSYRCSYRRVQVERQLMAESIMSDAENRRRAVMILT